MKHPSDSIYCIAKKNLPEEVHLALEMSYILIQIHFNRSKQRVLSISSLTKVTSDGIHLRCLFISFQNYRYLDLLNVLCVCDGVAIPDNQTYITEHWLRRDRVSF